MAGQARDARQRCAEPHAVLAAARMRGEAADVTAGRAPVEFVCEGCAAVAICFGITRVPAHQLCSTCAWLSSYAPKGCIMEVRRSVEAGGWVSERAQRFGGA